jgi:hypothetical protein
MAGTQNKKTRIWNIPAGFIETFARFGGFFHLPLNSERLKKLTESYVVSNSKIKQVLKIDQMPFSAVAGLQKTLESFNHKD